VMAWSFPQKYVSASPDSEVEIAGNVAVHPFKAGDSTYRNFTITRAPTEWGSFTRMIFEFYEKGDPVAEELVELELSYVDNYVRWFKARGATRMAATGGLGERLYPLLEQRYGDFIVRPVGENLHGAVILAKQNFPIEP